MGPGDDRPLVRGQRRRSHVDLERGHADPLRALDLPGAEEHDQPARPCGSDSQRLRRGLRGGDRRHAGARARRLRRALQRPLQEPESGGLRRGVGCPAADRALLFRGRGQLAAAAGLCCRGDRFRGDPGAERLPGALIGAAAALVTFFVAMRRSSTVAVTRLQRLLIVGVALLALGLAGPRAWSAMSQESSALDRYSPETAGGFSGRVDIWRSALAVAVDHWLLGAGIAQYLNYHQEYTARLSHLYDPRVLEYRLNTHSDVFGLLANYGLIGLALYLSVVGRLLREIWRAARYGAREHYIYPVLLATEVLLLGVSVFRDSFASPEFFVVLALVMLASRRAALGPAVTHRGAGVPVRPGRLAA
ncbi:MAG: O-antigen ligase family protein [Proteobacteria bacterium]|nr:O-antigen ligase family protein [Pseudomonadota bacterium]